MRTIQIQANAMKTLDQAHTYLAQLMDFPTYYGRNLDALYDMLTEIPQDTQVILPKALGDDHYLGLDGTYIIRVFQDAAQNNPKLHLILQ